MEEKLVSVIVPVYNAERYILRCVNSITSQTYRNIEVIIVDDGSKDKSGVLCDQLTIDSRVKVYHTSNAGVGAARNYGIDRAAGAYIMFVDSDDVCKVDMIAKMVSEFNDHQMAELVICGIQFFKEYPQVIKQVLYPSKDLTVKEYICSILLERTIHQYCGGPYNKLYKSDVIRRNGILFPKDVKYAEDFRFNMRYLKHIHTIRIYGEALYQYQMNTSGSLTYCNYHQFDVDMFWKSRQEAFVEFEDVFKKHDAWNERCEEISCLLMIFIISTAKLVCKNDHKMTDCKRIINHICKVSNLGTTRYSCRRFSCLDRCRLFALKHKLYYMYIAFEKTRYGIGRVMVYDNA